MNSRLRRIFKEVEKNYKTITRTYKILEKTYDMGFAIHPAGLWLLDNMYIIEQQYTEIISNKKNLKGVKLPTIKVGDGSKYTSIYHIADELIEGNKGYTDQNFISDCLRRHQKVSYLTSEEISLFPLMLRMATIKFIARICLNISNSQLQKIEVEKILKQNLTDYDSTKIGVLLYEELKMFKEDPSIAEKLKNTNTAFVEYLASRLKEMGQVADEFYDILNNEAEKIGFTVEEAIVKEHMEIAKTSDYIGKAITGLKQIESLNFREIFENVNQIDETLKGDYTKEFEKCDYKTKNRYRNRIIKLSKKFKLSETYIAKKAVECSIRYKKHVGFFLSGEEKYLLNEALGKPHLGETIFNKVVKPLRPYVYMLSIIILALSITVWFDKLLLHIDGMPFKIIYYICAFTLAFEVSDKFVNYVVRKTVSPKILPRFDFAKTIDKEYSTYVIMPTVISSFDKIDSMIRKMEVTYLANRSENMYYMLIGDCVSSNKQIIELDKKYVEYAKEKLDNLNNKYKAEHKLFNFMYRKRVYSKSEGCYMGWERKRGAIAHFNELVLGRMDSKRIDETMYLIYDDIIKTKFAITIDEDTELSLNTAKDLVAIIAHPLNAPRLSKDGRTVKSGHGLIQPAVGLDIEAANKSIFSKIFGGFGGLDIYTTAVSNTYQDLFNEAIFCGKGIYDIELFEDLLSKEIPENLVLSHDLLEGSFMRAGLASDIQIQDGFPNNYIAYTKRNHRWFRGDMQIIKWLMPKSPLNLLSKWKILDNIRRPLVDVLSLVMIIFSLFINSNLFVNTTLIIFLSINFGYILGMIDSFVFGSSKHRKELLYIPIIHGTSATILNMTFNFVTIPYKAYVCIDAFLKSIYRMTISKKKLLEWTTAEILEKNSKDKLSYYFLSMLPNVITGLAILFVIYFKQSMNTFGYDFAKCIGISFIIAPLFSYLLGKSYLFGRRKKLNKTQNKEIIDIAKRTWNFFDFVMTPVNNFLPTDNYQELRRYKIANRTSSTNIGMGILAIVNAYDLKFIDLEECILKLSNIMNTVEKLEKWNGHLFNWYNIKTLHPLRPRFVSTVDSGNFLACIYTLKGFLKEKLDAEKVKDELKLNITKLFNDCEAIIKNTDFTKLYDMSRNLFSIGFSGEDGRLVDSYYDMLMSENRTTSLIAIASKQITSKHWFALSRKLIKADGYKGLVSWSGTAFEYFMPYLFIKSYEHTLIDQSLFFAKYSQKKYVNSLDMPWGISEAAYAVMDNELNYQYKAFGVPWLGLKRGLKDFLVISPYASLLMLEYAPEEVYRNIPRLKKTNSYGSYGFYESIDYTKTHLTNKKYEVVKTYMAHHQGMILTSINNYINDSIVKKRFHSDASIEAADILLKERERIKVDMKKDKSLFNKRFKKQNIDNYTMFVLNRHIDRNYLDYAEDKKVIALLRGKDLSTIITSSGSTYLKFKNKIINKQRYKDMNSSVNALYITDKVSGNIIDVANIENVTKEGIIKKSNFYASLNEAEYYIETNDLEITTTVFLSPENSSEVRRVSIYNNTNVRREIEINTYIEPALTDYMTSVVHPSFNNLQIETLYDEQLDALIASKRLKNETDTELYMYSKLLGIDLDKDIETEKTKFNISGNKDTNAYDNKVSKYPLWPILSYRAKIILDPYERQEFYYVVGVEESKYKLTNAIVNLTINSVKNSLKFSNELNTVTARYLKLEEGEAESYNNIIYNMIFDKKKIDEKYWDSNINQSMLWKYSISGDLPILLVIIDGVEKMPMIDRVIDFMDYIKNRNIDIDIIVIAGDEKYSDKVYDYSRGKLNNSNFMSATKGEIYLFNNIDLNEEDINLFKFVAKKEIDTIDAFLPKVIKNINDSNDQIDQEEENDEILGEEK